MVPPSPAAMPADSCPRCCNAYSAKNARRAASWPGAKTPVMPHMRALFYSGLGVPPTPLVSIAIAEQLQDRHEDVDRVEVDLDGKLDGRVAVAARANAREIDEHQARKDDEREPRVCGRMDP